MCDFGAVPRLVSLVPGGQRLECSLGRGREPAVQDNAVRGNRMVLTREIPRRFGPDVIAVVQHALLVARGDVRFEDDGRMGAG